MSPQHTAFWVLIGIIGASLLTCAALIARQCRRIRPTESERWHLAHMTSSTNDTYQPPLIMQPTTVPVAGDAYIAIQDEQPLPPADVSIRRMHRIESTYDSGYLQKLHPTIQALVMHQMVADREAGLSYPRLSENHEYIFHQVHGTVKLKIGTNIAKGRYTTVFAVANNATMVIKYQANCDRLGRINSLARDFWFLRELSQTGVVPMSYFLSPPTRFVDDISSPPVRKTAFTMDSDLRRMCAADSRSEIRYMVMGRAYMTMSDVMANWNKNGHGVPFRTAITLGTRMIEALAVVHRRGIIHGDIHSSNVVLLDEAEHNVGFIDFGLSLFGTETVGRHGRARKYLEDPYCVYSLYENQGFRRAYRDDLYRAVLLLAMLMNNRSYFDYCMDLEQEPDEMLRFKRDSFLFSNPMGPDVVSTISGIDRVVIIRVRQHLANVLKIVRNLHQIDALPPYHLVLLELQAIHSLLPDSSRPRISSVGSISDW